jgi:hypothetical protein
VANDASRADVVKTVRLVLLLQDYQPNERRWPGTWELPCCGGGAGFLASGEDGAATAFEGTNGRDRRCCGGATVFIVAFGAAAVGAAGRTKIGRLMAAERAKMLLPSEADGATG